VAPGRLTLTSALTLALLLALPATAQQQARCGASASERSPTGDRFEDEGDGTVIDRASRRVWMRCLLGQTWDGQGCSGDGSRLNLAAAQAAAEAVNRSGALFFNDWRVPALPELASITERDCAAPRTNLAIFPATPADLHWTTTRQPGSTDAARAYALSFGAEGVQLIPVDRTAYVRLVRTGF
jgi:hypothetical protein